MNIEEYGLLDNILVDLACMMDYLEDIENAQIDDDVANTCKRIRGAIKACERTIEQLKDPTKRISYILGDRGQMP